VNATVRDDYLTHRAIVRPDPNCSSKTPIVIAYHGPARKAEVPCEGCRHTARISLKLKEPFL
jgi:hypothetical protein